MQVTTISSAERTRQAIARLTELPASVRVVQEALEACEDPLCTNEQLEGILEQDPGTTADLLRLANSPFFGVSNLIKTLAMAVTVVGRTRLITLLRHLIATKLIEALPAHSEAAKECRTIALAAGVVCHRVAEQTRASDPDAFMVAGLLHNVGEMALISEIPGEYQKVKELSTEMHLRMAEIAVLGVDQFQVSRWLLEAWLFPPPPSTLTPRITGMRLGIRMSTRLPTWLSGSSASAPNLLARGSRGLTSRPQSAVFRRPPSHEPVFSPTP